MRKLRNGLCLACVLLATGCSTITPWVKPYERQSLADELMLPGRHGVSIAYLTHVHESREGARGAAGSGGGGCGCN
ncbi:MAG: DUF4266 domain-containing protein [Enterobacterales bacterium]|nr:DUF4266 domain-containing protein [Enterobacterales bacterium]